MFRGFTDHALPAAGPLVSLTRTWQKSPKRQRCTVQPL